MLLIIIFSLLLISLQYHIACISSHKSAPNAYLSPLTISQFSSVPRSVWLLDPSISAPGRHDLPVSPLSSLCPSRRTDINPVSHGIEPGYQPCDEQR